MAVDSDTGSRVFSIGGVYSRAFALMAGPAGGTIFAISFMFGAVPDTLWGVAQPSLIATLSSPVWKGGMTVLGGLIPAIFRTIVYGALVGVVISSNEGQRVSIAPTTRITATMLLPLIGLAILSWLGTMLGMILILVPGLILAVMWSVASPALVAERAGIVPSLRRSGYLTKGVRWQILGTILVVFAVGTIIGTVGALFISAVGGGSFSIAEVIRAQTKPSVTGILVHLVSLTAMFGFGATLFSQLFVDLRDWKEGENVDRLADVFS